jgi:ribosomal protein S18 acetylase RimI-like enzyme
LALEFATLDRDRLVAWIDDLHAISADSSPWDISSFLLDLPGKWEHSFVAMQGGPVGYAILSRREPGWLHVHQFMVAPSRRGHGIGALMMGEARRRADAAGRSGLSLKVDRGAAAAIRFYERLGFRALATERGYLWMRHPAGAGDH